jgi:hypothetical protein
MQFLQLQGETTVGAVVQRIYGLAPGAPGAAAAQAALLAANPHLATIAQLPAGTPVVLPAVGVVSTPPVAATPPDPRRVTLLTTLQGLGNAVPLRATGGTAPDTPQQAAIKALQADLAAFAKLHGG